MDRKDKIERLKKEKNAVILAHYYTLPDVQDVADYVGDSFALSEKAATTEADVILFAGVHFMAETAKILNPNKIVLIPDLKAGCSLSDSCPTEDFAEFVKQHPDHLVISYINTTAEIKALTDIVCTSSNAVKIVESLPADQKIIFAPDRNLGSYIKKLTGRENMLIWDGACHVHEEFSVELLAKLKRQHPKAKVLAHPECQQAVLMMADYIGSTSSMLRFSQEDDNESYIVATEAGILHQMQKASPGKTFIPAPPLDATCGCNECEFMKLITMKKIELSLETLEPRVEIDEQIRQKAEKSIRRMLTYK